MSEEKEKNSTFITVYNRDYIKWKHKIIKQFHAKQEFKDPISEGFKKYLEVDAKQFQEPLEDGDVYMEKVKDTRQKIGKLYFQNPLDHITIKGSKLLEGKSLYQVDYCDIENDIRRKLVEKDNKKMILPDDWVIPITTQKYDYRDPIVLSKHALERPRSIRPINNLGQNENINHILNVKTGDSEYNQVIGKLGNFIVTEQMHGKINHPSVLWNNK